MEYYLCNEETEVYKAVEALNVGDVVDVEGFLYWYEGPNLHITSLTVSDAPSQKADIQEAAAYSFGAFFRKAPQGVEAPQVEAPAESAAVTGNWDGLRKAPKA